MFAKLENVICLEVTTNDKGYSSLHVYEKGKGPYGFRSLNVKKEKLSDASSLVGKIVSIDLSIFEGTGKNGKYTSYSFESVSLAK